MSLLLVCKVTNVVDDLVLLESRWLNLVIVRVEADQIFLFKLQVMITDRVAQLLLQAIWRGVWKRVLLNIVSDMTTAKLIHVSTSFLACVSKRDFEVIAFLELPAIQIPSFSLLAVFVSDLGH